VTPISTATNTAGPPIPVGRFPDAIAITPNGKPAYVANGDGTGTVTPITTATNTAGPPITVGNDPRAIAITPNGKTAYVANQGSDTVTPISTVTNTAAPPIAVGNGPTRSRLPISHERTGTNIAVGAGIIPARAVDTALVSESRLRKKWPADLIYCPEPFIRR